jgi:anaerobic ribonucleoside-triphosphate reductase activating protein
MAELVWIIDPATGDLVVEGLEAEQALALAGDLLPRPRALNCARPLAAAPLPSSDADIGPALRVAGLWHGSVVEGPGRRSVLQVQGCPLRCSPACFVPASHSLDAGAVVRVDDLVEALLDPVGEPRDGVSVLGGEPMAQPVGLAALLRRLKARGLHTTVYTGYTLAALARQSEPAVRDVLELTDLLIDGPFVPALADGAGEWRGSRNQRLIRRPARALRSGRTRLAAPR